MRKISGTVGPVLIILCDLSGIQLRKLVFFLMGLRTTMSNGIPDAVFGAFLSDAPSFSEHFQGTGETFLFTMKPSLQVMTH
jgi:hypothetical protein